MASTSENVRDRSPIREEEEQEEEKESVTSLTDAQRAKAERNRQRALLIRQKKQQERSVSQQQKREARPSGPIDTGGGFLLDPADLEEEEERLTRKVVHPLGAVLAVKEDGEEMFCEECGREFLESSLHETFGIYVCESCRDPEEKHKLITKSTAKDKYLLKDVDMDKREPILKFIEKKNPRNDRWGNMKLFLEMQVKKRAMEVWGSEEKIEEERERREESKQEAKQKRYDKKVKDLRLAVRSSLWTKDLGSHEHEYGPESYDDEEDEYSKTCTTCGHVLKYEKM